MGFFYVSNQEIKTAEENVSMLFIRKNYVTTQFWQAFTECVEGQDGRISYIPKD